MMIVSMVITGLNHGLIHKMSLVYGGHWIQSSYTIYRDEQVIIGSNYDMIFIINLLIDEL